MKHPFDRGILFPPEVENKRLTAGLPPEEFDENPGDPVKAGDRGGVSRWWSRDKG